MKNDRIFALVKESCNASSPDVLPKLSFDAAEEYKNTVSPRSLSKSYIKAVVIYAAACLVIAIAIPFIIGNVAEPEKPGAPITEQMKPPVTDTKEPPLDDEPRDGYRLAIEDEILAATSAKTREELIEFGYEEITHGGATILMREFECETGEVDFRVYHDMQGEESPFVDAFDYPVPEVEEGKLRIIADIWSADCFIKMRVTVEDDFPIVLPPEVEKELRYILNIEKEDEPIEEKTLSLNMDLIEEYGMSFGELKAKHGKLVGFETPSGDGRYIFENGYGKYWFYTDLNPDNYIIDPDGGFKYLPIRDGKICRGVDNIPPECLFNISFETLTIEDIKNIEGVTNIRTEEDGIVTLRAYATVFNYDGWNNDNVTITIYHENKDMIDLTSEAQIFIHPLNLRNMGIYPDNDIIPEVPVVPSIQTTPEPTKPPETTPAETKPPKPVITYPAPSITKRTATSITKSLYGCEYTISVDKAGYKAGDIVSVTVTLENKGESTLSFAGSGWSYLKNVGFYEDNTEFHDTHTDIIDYAGVVTSDDLTPGEKWETTRQYCTCECDHFAEWTIKAAIGFTFNGEWKSESLEFDLYHALPDVFPESDPYSKLPAITDFSSTTFEKRTNPFADIESAVLYKNGAAIPLKANDPMLVRLLNFMTYSDEEPIQSHYIIGGFYGIEDYEYATSRDYRLEIKFNNTSNESNGYISLCRFDRAIITEDTVYVVMTPSEPQPDHIGWIDEYSIICTGWFPYAQHFSRAAVSFDILSYAGFWNRG